MAIKSILSANQKILLSAISASREIGRNFYLTGGTALAEFYLFHRRSEDLDFFSENEFDPQSVYIFLKSIAKEAGIKKIDVQKSFNRRLFFLYLRDGDILKTEFTFFPFERIEKKLKIGRLAVDSLLDIAVNKLFTIYQNPRSRDFIDLYFILQLKKWAVKELVKKAKIKFDWHVDALQLGSQFLKAKEAKDYPKMIAKINHGDWQNFFITQAKRLGKQIFF